MATSGSNYYSPDGGTLRLVLSWSRIETDIANNRSKIRLTLQLTHGGTGVWFSARKSGMLHGQAFTYSGGFSNTGTKTLRTRELWVNHNSDGTKTITFNAKFDIAITYRGSWLGSMSTSVTANIDRIPRSSSINSFSIANHLKPSTSNSINLSISRASSSFTHDIELRDGSTVLSSWKGQGTPTSLGLTSSEVNTLLNRMSNVTSRTLTLRVVTKSGSSTIGSTSRNATVTVDSSVKPVVSGLTIRPSTNDFDGAYVQSHTKLIGSYSSSARGGATIQSQSITVSKDDDILVISGTSGTTPRAFKYSGTYNVVAETVDSRGRASTLSDTITVLPYWNPRIEKFEVKRRTDSPTIVDFQVETDVAYYARGDYFNTTIERQLVGTSLWEKVYSFSEIWTVQSGALYNNNVYNSYIFRLTVDDRRGGVATATTSIATQRVVLDIHKNEGVGIGKVHENGVLDVDGDIFVGGNQNRINTTNPDNHFNITAGGKDLYLRGSRILLTSSDIRSWSGSGSSYGLIESGSNANGDWVKFYDGTMICWLGEFRVSGNSSEVNVMRSRWNFPSQFLFGTTPAVMVTKNDYSGSSVLRGSSEGATSNAYGADILIMMPSGGSASRSQDVRLMAIGRWK